jgi:putative methyltransferase
MALVLIHDLLFTKRGIQSSDGPLKQAVMRHKARLKAELVKYKIKMGAKTNDDLVSQKVKDAGTWFSKQRECGRWFINKVV